MNEIINSLLNRKSTRAFSERQITEEIKNQIFEACFAAPTAGNMQLYSIIDVTDEKLKEELSVLCDNQPFIKEAKMVLVFLADYTKWMDGFNLLEDEARNIQESDLMLACADATIAAHNAVVAAESLGIGSCYIGDIVENAERVIELLGLPEYTYPACMAVFGYPNDSIKNQIKPKRFKKEYVVFENKYRRLNKQEIEDMFMDRCKGNYKEWMTAFMKRKHNSDFSIEMQRSARYYMNRFMKK